MTDGQLLGTVVYLSHILIRHREVETQAVSFCFADWKQTSPLPKRSRAEALRLAQSISARLRREPGAFGAYAKQHSEDTASASRGGSLGGRTALELSTFKSVLDALAALEPGGVSEAIETVYGFHILQRQALPERVSAGGRHLVIGYDDAGWLRNQTARGTLPHRTREEALVLANALWERARQDPGDFTELIRQHSEHRDADAGGEIGTWSTHAPSEYPAELEVLRTLPVGGISEPMDSLFGFEILQRTTDQPLARFAMNAVILNFDASEPSSKLETKQLAESIFQSLKRDPSRWLEHQRRYCCTYSMLFDEDPRAPELTRALSRLRVGEMSDKLIESGTQFIIAQRIAPESVPNAEPRLTLDFIEPPNVSYLLSRLHPDVVEGVLRGAAQEVSIALSLASPAAELLFDHQRRASRLFHDATEFEERVLVLDEFQESLTQPLGAAGQARHRASLEEQVEALYLRSSTSEPRGQGL